MMKRSANVHRLLETSSDARDYFNTLSKEVQDTLLVHGNGVNTLEELKTFAKVAEERGGDPHAKRMR